MARTRNSQREAPSERPEPATAMPPTSDDLHGLCIVLFGMPAAGKSSLLGALLQAAQTQPGLLGGELQDRGGGLEALQRRLYQERAQETLEEIVPYPVAYHPQGAAEPIPATLIDCDGRIAYSFLTGQRPLGATQGQVDLATAIEEAESILLVVDVSADPDELKRDFVQFSQFLRVLERHRGRRAAVAGLPVYLVLTKCDLLGSPMDTASQWLQRIEDAKRKISIRFRDFLAAEAKRQKAPFGQIDLHVWATAVKRPALADRPARATEPFGVAELFRQCFASGLSFTQVQKRAERRLQIALLSLVGFLAVLITVASFFIVTRPTTELTALDLHARTVLPPLDATATQRLRGPRDEKIKQLEAIRAHPEFAQLPEILRDRVHGALHELRTYQEQSERFREIVPLAEIGTEKELAALDRALMAIDIPDIYQEQWQTTELMRALEQRREQVSLFRLRVAEMETLLRKRIKQGAGLLEERPTTLKDANLLVTWLPQVRDYLNVKAPPPTDAVPGLPDTTYQAIYEFSTIAPLYQSLQVLEEQLRTAQKRVLDLLK